MKKIGYYMLDASEAARVVSHLFLVAMLVFLLGGLGVLIANGTCSQHVAVASSTLDANVAIGELEEAIKLSEETYGVTSGVWYDNLKIACQELKENHDVSAVDFHKLARPPIEVTFPHAKVFIVGFLISLVLFIVFYPV